MPDVFIAIIFALSICKLSTLLGKELVVFFKYLISIVAKLINTLLAFS